MRVVAIIGIGWATFIAGWFATLAAVRAAIAIRHRRQAKRVVKGAEEFLRTYTTDPATWPQPRRCRQHDINMVVLRLHRDITRGIKWSDEP